MEGWTKRRTRPCITTRMSEETRRRPPHASMRHPAAGERQALEAGRGLRWGARMQRRRRHTTIAPMHPAGAARTYLASLRPADRYQRGTFSRTGGTTGSSHSCHPRELCICKCESCATLLSTSCCRRVSLLPVASVCPHLTLYLAC